jgi:transcriptional regulator with XRE-family HTH domain
MTKINRLKVVLAEKEKSGKWLAVQLGKSTCTISKWCSNTTQPDLLTLNKIANLLQVDVKTLLNSNLIEE